MKKIYYLLLIFAAACNPNKTTEPFKKKYFDIEGFINQKTKVMAKQKITNKKSVLIDAKTETIANDITNWQKEFAPFIAADINKQAYQTSYIEAKSSNGITYTLKDSEDLPLKLLIITVDSLRNEPKKIEANIVVHNYLYNSEKYLAMTLSNGNISEYNIESNLKLFLGDKKTFRISGKLSYGK